MNDKRFSVVSHTYLPPTMKSLTSLTPSSRLRSLSGFTLIEIMLVVVIIGLISSAALVGINAQRNRANKRMAKAMVEGTFYTALESYEQDRGEYPSTSEGLKALLNPSKRDEAYLRGKEIPKDPWGQEYLYESPGSHNSDSYDLSSKGPDRKAGTEDDITNW